MSALDRVDVNAVLYAVDTLNGARRRANLSAVARLAGMSRTRARDVLDRLRADRVVEDRGTGAAYDWHRVVTS